MTLRRSACGALVLGALLALLAYGSAWHAGGAPSWGIAAMIAGIALMLAATLMLGARRSGMKPTRVVAVALFLLVVVVGGFGLAFFLAPDPVGADLWLGLPRRAAIEIYGVGLLPLLVLPIVFAMEFRAADLDAASLEALRRECAELRAGERAT